MKVEETKEYQTQVEIENRLHGLNRDLLDLSEELRYYRGSLMQYNQISKVEYMQHSVAEILKNVTRLSKLLKEEKRK